MVSRVALLLAFILAASCAGCYEQQARPTGHVTTNFALKKTEEADARLKEKAYDAALALADEAIADDPGCVDAHALRGNALGHLGRFEEAAAALMQAETLEPETPFLPVVRGVYLERMGKPDEAQAAYAKGVDLYAALKAKQRLSPDESLGWAAAVYLSKGRNDGVIAFNDVLGQYPKLRSALVLKERVVANDREYFMRWTMKDEGALEGNE